MPRYIPEEYYWFDCLGVFHKKNVFPIDKINEAYRVFEEHKRTGNYSAGQKGNEFIKHSGIWEAHPIFLELATHPEVLKFCSYVFGGRGSFRLDHAFIVQGNQSVITKGKLHGQSYGKQMAHYYLSQGQEHAEWPCWVKVGQLTVGVVLKGQDPDDGGFCYIPGSHKTSYFISGHALQRGLLKLDDIGLDHPYIIVPKLDPGDLIAFPESLTHGQTHTDFKPQRCVSYNMFFPMSTRFLDWSKQYAQIRKHTQDENRLQIIKELPDNLMTLDKDYISH